MYENPYFMSVTNFVNWLKLFDPKEVVGYKKSTLNCPIKNHLNTFDPQVHAVGTGYVRVTNGKSPMLTRILLDDENGYPLGDLIKAIDHIECREVTAEAALAAVERCYPLGSIQTSPPAKELTYA